MTTTASPTGSALVPLVDVLVAEPLDTLNREDLQAQIRVVTPQVDRLQGWLTSLAGRLDELTGGNVPDPDSGRPVGDPVRVATSPTAAVVADRALWVADGADDTVTRLPF